MAVRRLSVVSLIDPRTVSRGPITGGSGLPFTWIFACTLVASSTVCACTKPSTESARPASPPRGVVDAHADVGFGAPIHGPDAAVAAPTYPVDTTEPKDFFDDRLLRALGREASAVIVCKLAGLFDLFPKQHDPDVFYEAACDVEQVVTGRMATGQIHFVWQVERGSRLPPPGAELLVYLKARKQPLDAPPPLTWVSLDTGVLRWTPKLAARFSHVRESSR